MEPKLRFKEFSGDWEEKKIGNILKIKHGKDQKEIEIENGKYPILGTGGVIGSTNTPICTWECVLIGRKGTIDKPQYMNTPFWTVDTLFYSKPEKDNNAKYQYYLFQTINWKKYNEASGVPSLSDKTIESIKINTTSLPEQTKIADFLSTVDEKIQNQQDKITHLENIKKGFMQKIFSRKIRFKDANGNEFPEWEETTIGKSGYFYYGKSAPKWSIKENATTPCIRYGELYTTHNIIVKNIKSYTNIDKENLKFSKGNEVLVPRVGEEPLDFCKCCYLPFPNIAIGEMISVYNTENNPLFISYLFNATMKYEFARRVEGGNVSNLYFVYLENIPMMLPCLEEQQKIADFLSSFDDKIDAEKETLEHLKELKKGLLQQMFV